MTDDRQSATTSLEKRTVLEDKLLEHLRAAAPRVLTLEDCDAVAAEHGHWSIKDPTELVDALIARGILHEDADGLVVLVPVKDGAR